MTAGITGALTRRLLQASHDTVLVGVMSGTSLDGITAAAVRFTEAHDGRITPTVLSHAHRPYAPTERTRLERAMQGDTAQAYCRLQAELGEWLGDAARRAMQQAGLTPSDVTAIASHGHTIWHEAGHSTWQMGDAARIAEVTGCAVVADFRARDVAVGGQGAPLVPMADARLFAHPTVWRALQNLGGIGNVTLVPPSSTHAADVVPPVQAFDTGPGVVLIDGVTRALWPTLSYDRDGRLARAGTVLEPVVAALMEAPYFSQHPPKSTGRELFTAAYRDDFIARCRALASATRPVDDTDIVATATAFTARTIADQYARFLEGPVGEVVLSGGGARNPTLVDAITVALQQSAAGRGQPAPPVQLFDTLFFDAEAKEAVAFALLGYLHLTGRSGNVPHATGARAGRLLGHFTPAG
ncbi:MAG: anhydro-N-acetylmuramic acid kinase [Gemmatimonadaceae bacterium]